MTSMKLRLYFSSYSSTQVGKYKYSYFSTHKESQNHRMTWVGRDLKDHEDPTPLLHAGPPTSKFNTRPGCPGPHPAGPWTPPGTGHPQPLWAACSSVELHFGFVFKVKPICQETKDLYIRISIYIEVTISVKFQSILKSVQFYCKVMGKGSYVQSCYPFLFVYLYTLFYLHMEVKYKHILNQNKQTNKRQNIREKKKRKNFRRKKKKEVTVSIQNIFP